MWERGWWLRLGRVRGPGPGALCGPVGRSSGRCSGPRLQKVVSASCFAYVVQIFPAIIFGEELRGWTDGYLGITETVVAMGLLGVVYTLLAGNGMVLVGVTGPSALKRRQLRFFGWRLASVPYHDWTRFEWSEPTAAGRERKRQEYLQRRLDEAVDEVASGPGDHHRV